MRLEEGGRELRHLRADLGPGEVEGGAADRLRPAAERADALLHDAGVAVVDADVLERHPELVGEHLRERRLVALAVGRGAGGGADAAVALDGDLRVLPPAGGQRGGRAEAAHLHVHRQPQAHQPPLGAGGVALALQLLPARVLEGPVEGLGVVARVVDGAHLGLVGEPVGGDEVPAPQLGRVHAEPPGQHVHAPLDEVGGLGPPRPAVGVGGGLVGEHLAEGGADGRDVVGGVGHQHRQGGDGRRQQHVVGADVGDEPQLQPQHLPVAGRRDVDVADDVAPVDGGEKRLGAVLGPLQGHAEPLGEGRHDVLLAVDVDLGPEPAPDLGRDGAHLVLTHPVQLGDERAQDVGVLRRRPDGHRALAPLVVGDDAARLHRGGGEALVHHALRHHDVGVGERLVDGAVVHRLAVGRHAGPARHQGHRQVVVEVGVDHRRVAGHRHLGVDHRGPHLVVDDDGVGGVPGRVAVRGHDHRHRLADVAHDVGGHGAVLGRRERGADGHRVEERGDLRPREHRLDAVHRLGRARVDRPDAAVGDIAALEGGVPQAEDLHVVDVGAVPLDEPRVLAPLDALAHELRQDRSGAHDDLLAAAFCTALTMCW